MTKTNTEKARPEKTRFWLARDVIGQTTQRIGCVSCSLLVSRRPLRETGGHRRKNSENRKQLPVRFESVGSPNRGGGGMEEDRTMGLHLSASGLFPFPFVTL